MTLIGETSARPNAHSSTSGPMSMFCRPQSVIRAWNPCHQSPIHAVHLAPGDSDSPHCIYLITARPRCNLQQARPLGAPIMSTHHTVFQDSSPSLSSFSSSKVHYLKKYLAKYLTCLEFTGPAAGYLVLILAFFSLSPSSLALTVPPPTNETLSFFIQISPQTLPLPVPSHRPPT